MKSMMRVMGAALLCAWAVNGVDAQEDVASEKQAVIEQLLDLTNAREVAAQGTDIILQQMEASYLTSMAGLMDQEQLTSSQQRQQALLASRLRFFNRFRELYPQRANLAGVVEEIYIPLYDKYFTKAELDDLVTFYRSPTGKKATQIMPDLLQESMERSQTLLNPIVTQIVTEIMQEERLRLLDELREPVVEEVPIEPEELPAE